MKKYIVNVYDTVAVYNIKAENKQEAMRHAVKQYKKDKDNWLSPRMVETVDEYEVEDTQHL